MYNRYNPKNPYINDPTKPKSKLEQLLFDEDIKRAKKELEEYEPHVCKYFERSEEGYEYCIDCDDDDFAPDTRDYTEKWNATLCQYKQSREVTHPNRLFEWERSELKKLYDAEKTISTLCMVNKKFGLPVAKMLSARQGSARNRVQALTKLGCVHLPKKYHSCVEWMRLPLEYVDVVTDYIFPVYNMEMHGKIKKGIRILIPNSLAPKGPVVQRLPEPKWEVFPWEKE
jgi:hypothetical protein